MIDLENSECRAMRNRKKNRNNNKNGNRNGVLTKNLFKQNPSKRVEIIDRNDEQSKFIYVVDTFSRCP